MELSGLWVLVPSYAQGWFIALFMTFSLWSYLEEGAGREGPNHRPDRHGLEFDPRTR